MTRKEKQNLKEATIAAIAQAVIHADQQWSGLAVLSLQNHHHHSEVENLPLHTHKSYLYCGSWQNYSTHNKLKSVYTKLNVIIYFTIRMGAKKAATAQAVVHAVQQCSELAAWSSLHDHHHYHHSEVENLFSLFLLCIGKWPAGLAHYNV